MIAEGIEENHDLDRISTAGIAMAQGFLLGRPVRAEALAFGELRRTRWSVAGTTTQESMCHAS